MTDMTRAAVSRRHFLQLVGAGMLVLTGTALTGCGNSTSGEGSDKGSKLAAIKSRGHLNAGVKKDVPGYGYYDTAKGRFEGMEVDLCYQIAAAVFGVSYKEARAQELVEFTDVTPKTSGPLIDNGQLDVVAATYTITDERKKAVDFSSSYYNDSQSVVVKKDSKFANATKVSDLKDVTVGVMVATLAYDYAKANIKDDIQTFNDDAALAQALDAGQIDVLVTSTVECVYMVQSEQVKDAKVLGRLPDSEDKSGMGIVLPKDSKLTAAVTKAVDDLNADGTIKKLQDKWLAEYTTDLTELKK